MFVICVSLRLWICLCCYFWDNEYFFKYIWSFVVGVSLCSDYWPGMAHTCAASVSAFTNPGICLISRDKVSPGEQVCWCQQCRTNSVDQESGGCIGTCHYFIKRICFCFSSGSHFPGSVIPLPSYLLPLRIILWGIGLRQHLVSLPENYPLRSLEHF